jgi:hypothetical protein
MIAVMRMPKAKRGAVILAADSISHLRETG